MQDNHNDNLEGEEFELDDLEGGFSSLSSIFADRNKSESGNIEFEVDEEAGTPAQPGVPAPGGDEPDDDDIVPPVLSREAAPADQDINEPAQDDIVPSILPDHENHSSQEDFATPLASPEGNQQPEPIPEEQGRVDLVQGGLEDGNTEKENQEGSGQESFSVEESVLPPSPAFGSLSDREPGPTIGDEPTPFEALSEDDISEQPSEEIAAAEEESAVAEEPVAVEEEPVVAEEPVASEEEPAVTEEPVASEEEPAVAEEPVVVGSGFFGGIKAKMAAAKAFEANQAQGADTKSGSGVFASIGKKRSEVDNKELAGVDSSKPSLIESLKSSRRSKQLQDDQPPSDFEKLLTPLSGADLALLQQELEQEEPIFEQLNKAKKQANMRQAIGLLVGLVVIAFFALSVGKEYLTVTLAGAPIPDWVPVTSPSAKFNITDLVGGLFFGLGLMLPIVALFAIAESVAVLWRALAFGRLKPLIESIIAAVCGFGILICLIEQNITFACVLALIWVVARIIIAKLIRRSG